MSYNKEQERLDAQRYAAQRENARAENTAALSGMTLGILLILAIAVAAGAFYLFSNRRDEPGTAPVIAPTTSPALPEKQTIIREEKTRELVPVPQATSAQPDINITVPSAPSPVAAPPNSNSAAGGSSSAESPVPSKPESPAVSPSPSSVN
jgi:hypothetical protein